MDVLLQDVDRVRNHVVGLAGAGVPLVLLGQSMGGLIALRYQQEFAPPIHGLVLVAPWLATAMKVPRWKSLATPLLSRLLPALPFRTRLNPEHLSRDPAEVAAYRAIHSCTIPSRPVSSRKSPWQWGRPPFAPNVCAFPSCSWSVTTTRSSIHRVPSRSFVPCRLLMSRS
jgi:alpha-beta hydrolase superfamily lysophospholipase